MNNKILVISSEFPPGPGGVGQHAYSLSIALSKKSNVYVLANQDYTTEVEIAKFQSTLPANVRVTNLVKGRGKLTSLKRMVQAIRLVKTLNPDVIYTTGRYPVWIGAVLKMRFGRKRIFAFAHGSEVHAAGGILGKITYTACAKHDGIIAVSKFTASLLKAQGLQKIQVLPNGLDDAFIVASEAQIDDCDTYAWVGSPRLLTVGNVSPRKGQHRVINALPTILKKFPNAHYHVVGLPTTADKLVKLAEDLGVAQSVTFHGKLATRQVLYKAFKTADVFLMLSENQANGDVEGFGIAILEANAFGVPSIGATGCGIEDAIGEESGILVDGNNAEEITQAINQIVTDETFYKIGARKWAEQHNWKEIIKKLPFF